MGNIRMYDLTLPALRDLAVTTLDLREQAENPEDRRRLTATLDEIINQYTADSKAACYRAAMNSGDPMAYACQEFFFPAIRIKEVKDKETATVSRSIEDTMKPIDLANLHSKVKGGIGKDHMWIDTIQTFNADLTVRAANRLGDGTLADLLSKYPECYRMSDTARTIKKEPLTDETMIGRIDEILKMMIGDEYEADEKDLNEICDNYISNDRKSKTSFNAANHRTLIELFKKVCYRHLNGFEGYGVATRELKK